MMFDGPGGGNWMFAGFGREPAKTGGFFLLIDGFVDGNSAGFIASFQARMVTDCSISTLPPDASDETEPRSGGNRSAAPQDLRKRSNQAMRRVMKSIL
jgi:hypothetical protein